MPNKAIVICDGEILSVDWIMHEGKAWLVPDWFLSPDGKSQRPARIVSLKLAPGYQADIGEAPLQFFQQPLLTDSILFQGKIPPELLKIIEIREEPDIWLPNPELSN